MRDVYVISSCRTAVGKYIGTLKDGGFYYVNPFCTAVNPAAKTKLNQPSK